MLQEEKRNRKVGNIAKSQIKLLEVDFGNINFEQHLVTLDTNLC
jgi:hypothetical protein